MMMRASTLMQYACLISLGACAVDDSPIGLEPRGPSRLEMIGEGRIGPRLVNRRPDGVDSYIVVLKPAFDHQLLAEAIAREVHGKVGYVYQSFNGFTIHSISTSDLDSLVKRKEIQAIEKSGPQRLASTQTLPSDGSIWHLDQIDQLGGARNQTFNYFYPGQGVHIYILDTGIDTSSGEFAGRIGNGMAYTQHPGSLPYQPTDRHGTMVAGLAASSTYGTAKAATIHSARVFADTGPATTEDILSALDWISIQTANNPNQPAVVNVSIVTPSNQIREAYRRLIDGGFGVPIVKAAGNDSLNACADSSNTVPWLIVVAASDQSDTRWSGSNWGPCVSIFAPGVGVKSVSLPGFSDIGTATSYATPIVTGVVASIVQEQAAQYPGEQWAARAYNVLTLSALQGVVGNPNGSPNRRVSSLHTFFDFIGDSDIYTQYDQNVSWSLRTLGGDGTWQGYVWEYSTDNVFYSVVGTAASYNRYIAAGSAQNFYLRATATSAGQTFHNTLYIQLHPCNPPECPF